MERNFIPGSEWLYFKFYTGHKSADTVLTNCIYPLVTGLKSANLIREFFFIRYADPEFHIRLRLHVDDTMNYGIIFKRFHEIFSVCVADKLICKIQCDTYNREIERYGEYSMPWVESFFCADSLSVIELLRLNPPEQDRWLSALKMIDDTLNLCKYSHGQKEIFMKQRAEQFVSEFNFRGHFYKKQLDDKYRNNQKLIRGMFTDPGIALGEYLPVLQQRMDDLQPFIAEIGKEPDLNKPIDDLLPGLLHMSMNRLFRSRNRLYEMVIYDFLSRYYISVGAQKKRSRNDRQELLDGF